MRSSEPSAPVGGSELEAVRQRIERWRQTHKLRTRIPDDLWASAVELAKVYGLKGTARTLRLDNYSLKKRIEATGHSESPLPQGKSAFVELIAARPGAFAECTVELERPRIRAPRTAGRAQNIPHLGPADRVIDNPQVHWYSSSRRKRAFEILIPKHQQTDSRKKQFLSSNSLV